MNSAIRTSLNCILFFLGFHSMMAQDAPPLYISQGIEVSAQKLLLSLEGLSLNDQGNLRQDSSTFRFYSGDQEENQFLYSDASFYKLELALAGTSLKLESDLKLEENLFMESGLLNLNTHTLYLEGENSRIEGENEQNRITGTGMIEKQSFLSFPHLVKPGNMGMEISVEADLGLSTLRRIHKLSADNSLAILERKYELIPSLPADVPIAISLDYFEPENPFAQGESLIPLEEKQNQYGKLAYFTDRPFQNKMDILLPPVQKDWQLAITHKEKKPARGPQLLELGPNPFQHRLEIKWGNRADRATGVKLYASGGVLVYQQSISTYEGSFSLEKLGDLAAGMYVLKIETDSGMILSQTLLKGSQE
ncbi:MAG: T9SS type A sorting domain-containing protein [Bacteroidia bacterium]|nr:T9SS type A sorting domain-containing protein [Bacteroidia bacterium]